MEIGSLDDIGAIQSRVAFEHTLVMGNSVVPRGKNYFQTQIGL